MIRSFNQLTLNEQGIIAALGRKPSVLEQDILKHFYFSKYMSNPIPELSNITSYGKNSFAINDSSLLIVGSESKGSIISSSAKRPLTALGIKPGLRYQGNNSKISFGIAKRSHIEDTRLFEKDELIFLQDSAQLVRVCADILQREKVSIKEVGPASLGHVLNTLSSNQFGVDIHLSALTKISIFSDKNIHGVLAITNKKEITRIKSICKKYKQDLIQLGRLKNVQFMTISVRKKTKAHFPISILNIAEPPRTSIVPAVQQIASTKQLSKNRELKNYSKQVLDVWKFISKKKHEKFKPNSSQIYSIGILKHDSEIAVSIPDNLHLLQKDIKNGCRIITSNAARQLVCKGYKPLTAALIISAKNLEENDTQWNVQEIFTGVYETLQHIGINMAKPVISTNTSSKLDMELCVVGVKTFEHEEDMNTFKDINDFITLLGSHRGELNSSFYQEKILKQKSNLIPTVDQQMEARLQETVLQGIQTGLIKSAVNVSVGGIVTALIRSLKNTERGIGARIHLSRKLRQDEMLFGETQGMVVVSIGERDLMEFERICMTIGVPSTTIGRVTNDGRFKFNDVVNLQTNKL